VLWTPFFEALLLEVHLTEQKPEYQIRTFPHSVPAYLLWLAYEMSWWFIVTILLAVLCGFVAGSGLWSQVTALLTTKGQPGRVTASVWRSTAKSQHNEYPPR
jgi:hypothetical protein